jgi:transporter family protein
MSWLTLAVFSALFLGLYDVAKKSAVHNNSVLITLWLTSVCGCAVVIPMSIWAHFDPDAASQVGFVFGPLSAKQYLLILAKAALVTSSWVCSFLALKHLPITIVSPVRSSTPFFTLLGAIFLYGEVPSLLQGCGLASILCSYVAYSVIGRKEGIHFESNQWVWLLFGGTLLGSLSGLYDKHLLQGAMIPAGSLQLWFTVFNALIQGAIAYGFRNTGDPETHFQWRWAIPAVGILLLLADQAYFQALAIPGAYISVISSVRRSNVLLSFTLGTLLYRDKNPGPKALALVGVLVGLILLFF